MKHTLPVRVRFGAFEFDLKSGELLAPATERKIVLSDQLFYLLVTREEIQKKLWPNDTVVEFDHGINTAIQKLRQALGDSADKPSYIQTMARRGYRLIVPVEPVESSSDEGLEVGPFPVDKMKLLPDKAWIGFNWQDDAKAECARLR